MSYWVLPKSVIPILCSTVQKLTMLEQRIDETKQKMNSFDDGLEDKFSAISSEIAHSVNPNDVNILGLEYKDEEFIAEYKRVIDNKLIPHKDKNNPRDDQDYLGMELGLPHGPDDTLRHGTVKRHIKDDEGNPVGKANNNPFLDSR